MPAEGKGNILLQQVSKEYANNGQSIQALTEIDLEIPAGRFVSLLGVSGCGKSTLLRLLAGLESPTSGHLYIDGKQVEGPHFSRGLVFQDPTLFPWLTVKDNIIFGPTARGERINDDIVNEYLDLTGLQRFKEMYPYQLSGGMAQRAALARVLINHPVVLLLDEPLGALDALTRMQMQDELYQIWHTQHTTVVLVTHDVDEAIYLSQQVVILTPGQPACNRCSRWN